MRQSALRLLLSIWLLCLPSITLASQAHEQANRCSALFMILTSIQKIEAGLGQYFTQLGQLSGMMTSIYLSDATGRVATNGQISDMKLKAMKKIGRNFPEKKDDV